MPIINLQHLFMKQIFFQCLVCVGPERSATDPALNQNDLVPCLMELTSELSDSFIHDRMLSPFTLGAGYFTQYEIAKNHLVTNLLKANSLLIIWSKDELAEILRFSKKNTFALVSLKLFSWRYILAKCYLFFNSI